MWEQAALDAIRKSKVDKEKQDLEQLKELEQLQKEKERLEKREREQKGEMERLKEDLKKKEKEAKKKAVDDDAMSMISEATMDTLVCPLPLVLRPSPLSSHPLSPRGAQLAAGRRCLTRVACVSRRRGKSPRSLRQS